jgi:hypothetical protein
MRGYFFVYNDSVGCLFGKRISYVIPNDANVRLLQDE